MYWKLQLMNPCNAKKCKSIKLCELLVCVCVLVLGHSHSALKSRQLTAHTTGNARAPARAASQDCSAWEPTQRGRILRFTFYGQSESRRVQHLFSALLLLLFAVLLLLLLMLLLLTLGVRICRLFGFEFWGTCCTHRKRTQCRFSSL